MFWLCTAVFAAGCGGGPSTTYAKDVAPIIAAGCACHTGGSAGGLSLAADVAYDNLVNKKASDGTSTLVTPNKPTESLLYLKVSSDSPPVGDRMPKGGKLDDAQIEIVKKWIEEGAVKE